MPKWLVIYGLMALLVSIVTTTLAIYNTKKVEGYVSEDSVRWISRICLGAGILWPLYFLILAVAVVYDLMKIIVRKFSR